MQEQYLKIAIFAISNVKIIDRLACDLCEKFREMKYEHSLPVLQCHSCQSRQVPHTLQCHVHLL